MKKGQRLNLLWAAFWVTLGATPAMADEVLAGAVPDYVGVLGSYIDPADRRGADYRYGGAGIAGYQLNEQISAEIKAYAAGLRRHGPGTHNILGLGGDFRATERHGFFVLGGAGLEYGSVEDAFRASPYLEVGGGFQHRILPGISVRLDGGYRLLANLGRNKDGEDGGFGGEPFADAGLVFDWPGHRLIAAAPSPAIAVVPIRCPAAPDGMIVDANRVLLPQDSRNVAIGFGTNSAQLDRESKMQVELLARALACGDAQQLVVQVVGHADIRSNEIYNVELSRRRADAVRSALIENGLNPDRIGIAAEGEYSPLETGNNPTVNTVNRRIEIKLYSGVKPE